jgi:hypothetical protein
MGSRIHVLRASNDQEIDAAFETLGKEDIHALIVASSPYFDTRRNRIVQLASQIQFLRSIIFANTLSQVGLLVTASILWTLIGKWRSTPARF